MKKETLGKYLSFINGYTFSKDDWGNSGYKIIRIQNLTEGEAAFNQSSYIPNKKYLVNKGDLLFSWAGTLGVFKWEQETALLNQHIYKVEVKEDEIISKEFSYYLLIDTINELSSKMKGSTMKHISKSDLEKHKINLPDIETQNKIVATLDKISSLIEKRKKTIELLNEIITATFLDMFGDPVTNSKNWTTEKLHNIITSINAGKSITAINRPKGDNEIGVLKISAVTYGDFRPENNKTLTNSNFDTSELVFPKKGDLLISRANTKELVGATSIVNKDYNDVFLPDKIWKLTTDLNRVSPLYIHNIFSNKYWRMYFTKDSTGSGGSMFNISQETFKNIEIPLPNIVIQSEFEIFYNKLIGAKSKLQVSLKNLETLFQSIQQKVFKGEEVLSEEKIFDELLKTFEIKDFLDKRQRIKYLVKSLNDNTLKELDIYEKAKNIAFELLNKGEITQKYDSLQEKILLKNTQ